MVQLSRAGTFNGKDVTGVDLVGKDPNGIDLNGVDVVGIDLSGHGSLTVRILTGMARGFHPPSRGDSRQGRPSAGGRGERNTGRPRRRPSECCFCSEMGMRMRVRMEIIKGTMQ